MCEKCIEFGAPREKTNESNILPFYSACLYSEQLKGLFAQKILLVEGDTEALSLPYYFERVGFNLEANGIEIVKCQGKNNILKYYRFFTAYGYRCFCLFDADEEREKVSNEAFVNLFAIGKINQKECDFNIGDTWGCFGVDFESYMRTLQGYYNKKEFICILTS